MLPLSGMPFFGEISALTSKPALRLARIASRSDLSMTTDGTHGPLEVGHSPPFENDSGAASSTIAMIVPTAPSAPALAIFALTLQLVPPRSISAIWPVRLFFGPSGHPVPT